jgi:hypothetical protein
MAIEILPHDPKQIAQVAARLLRTDLQYPAVPSSSPAEDGSDDAPIEEVLPVVVRLSTDPDDLSLMWTCQARFRNHLKLTQTEEFLAKRMTWTYGRIAWSAGGGWPTYEVPCPRRPGLPTHRLKVVFGGGAHDPCAVPYSAVGQHMTSVFAMVSDDRYDDNTGTFQLIVTAYSRE